MAWLAGYSYRKAITLSRPSGAVTNYQMKLLVGESAGAVGEDVDCGGKVLPSFDDLRFTAVDGTTLLDYWIESITGTTPNQLATAWIEFDSIGTGATTFYMYYGKADAPAVSSGASTFILFDDFERGINGDAIGGSWTVSSGVATISTDHPFSGTRCAKIAYNGTVAYILGGADNNKAIRIRGWKENLTQYMILIWGEAATYSARLEGDASENILYEGATRLDSTYDMVADVWGLWEFIDINTTTHKFSGKYNDVKVVTDVSMSTSAFGAFGVNNTDAVSGRDFYIDDFIVRNYRTVEPIWGSWGVEESEEPPPSGTSFVAWIN